MPTLLERRSSDTASGNRRVIFSLSGSPKLTPNLNAGEESSRREWPGSAWTPNRRIFRGPLGSSGTVTVPKSGHWQVQLRAHARAAFASQTIGSISYPFAVQFHIELGLYGASRLVRPGVLVKNVANGKWPRRSRVHRPGPIRAAIDAPLRVPKAPTICPA